MGRRLILQPERPVAHDLIIAAHAAQTGRTVLTFNAKARFADLPGVSATDD